VDESNDDPGGGFGDVCGDDGGECGGSADQGEDDGLGDGEGDAGYGCVSVQRRDVRRGREGGFGGEREEGGGDLEAAEGRRPGGCGNRDGGVFDRPAAEVPEGRRRAGRDYRVYGSEQRLGSDEGC